jgi:hypothetical protein
MNDLSPVEAREILAGLSGASRGASSEESHAQYQHQVSISNSSSISSVRDAPTPRAERLLAAFADLTERRATARDLETAEAFAAMDLDMDVFIERIRARANANGSGWRPNSLRYFVAMAEEVAREHPSSQRAEVSRKVGICAGCKNAGLVADRSHPTYTRYSKCPVCHGKPPLDPDYYAEPTQEPAAA